MHDTRQFLRSLFEEAVAHAQAENLIGGNLPPCPSGKTIVIGAGKAAGSMARAVEDHWPGELSGLVITPYDHAVPCERIEVVEAAHPVPDAAGQHAAKRILANLDDLRAEDLILCLLSGGGSALLTIPAEGISLRDKQYVTAALLKSGAGIAELNCVRKHLSAVKGGRLTVAGSPAHMVCLAISDVPGNDISVIASGPTVPDATTREMAREILQRHAIAAPAAVFEHLAKPASESPKPGDPVFDNSEFVILVTAEDAMAAAAKLACKSGIEPVLLGDLTGDAGALARQHAALAMDIAAGKGNADAPCVLISGGETTVNVRGQGKGGRNAEYALALTIALNGHPDISAIAADTDGIDGTEDNAGCYVMPDSLRRAVRRSLDARSLLTDNDSYRFFSTIGDLLLTGPTRTNVNDFRAILITR